MTQPLILFPVRSGWHLETQDQFPFQEDFESKNF